MTPLEAIEKFVEESGGVPLAAPLIGVKPGMLYHVLNGVRGISKRIAIGVHLASNGKYSKEFLLFADPEPRRKSARAA